MRDVNSAVFSARTFNSDGQILIRNHGASDITVGIYVYSLEITKKTCTGRAFYSDAFRFNQNYLSTQRLFISKSQG